MCLALSFLLVFFCEKHFSGRIPSSTVVLMGSFKQMIIMLVFMGRTGWSSPRVPNSSVFCVTLPASLGVSTSSPWHMTWKKHDGTTAVCQHWSLQIHVGNIHAFSLCHCKCLGTTEPRPCQPQVHITTRCSQTKHKEKKTKTWSLFFFKADCLREFTYLLVLNLQIAFCLFLYPIPPSSSPAAQSIPPPSQT